LPISSEKKLVAAAAPGKKPIIQFHSLTNQQQHKKRIAMHCSSATSNLASLIALLSALLCVLALATAETAAEEPKVSKETIETEERRERERKREKDRLVEGGGERKKFLPGMPSSKEEELHCSFPFSLPVFESFFIIPFLCYFLQTSSNLFFPSLPGNVRISCHKSDPN
jgi:hypothetical protein